MSIFDFAITIYNLANVIIVPKHAGCHVFNPQTYIPNYERDRYTIIIRKKRRYFGRQPPIVQPNRLERGFKGNSPKSEDRLTLTDSFSTCHSSELFDNVLLILSHLEMT